MRTVPLSAGVLVLAMAVSGGCSSSKPQASAAPSPAVVLAAIPQVDPARFEQNRHSKNWQNPYLILRPDGVGLVDLKNSEIVILKPDQLPDALAKLPSSAWPYGRVVAITEPNVKNSSEEERVLLRKNRAIVAGTLRNLQVLIHWIPES